MGLIEATAAPTLVRIGDQEYRLRAVTLADLGEFEAWLQDSYIAMVRRSAATLPEAERRAEIERAQVRAATMTYGSPEAVERMLTPAGALKMLWLSLRHEHPDVQEQTLFNALMRHDAYDDALRGLETMLTRSGLVSKKADPATTAPGRRRKGRAGRSQPTGSARSSGRSRSATAGRRMRSVV